MDLLTQRRSQLSPEKQALLAKRLRGQGPTAPNIPRRTGGGPARLSHAQRRLWFLDRLEPGTPTYNVPGTVVLDGDLDAPALAASLAEIVDRHEVLRAVFPCQGEEPLQVVLPPAEVPLPRVDLAALPPSSGEDEAQRLAAEEARRGFDLAMGPLLRASLLRLGARRHRLLLTLHHIVADGWSVGVLIAELAALYESFLARRPSPLPELPVQYPDYAEWQLEALQGEPLAELLAFWKSRLEGAPQTIELPLDRPRPAARTFRGARRPFSLAPALAGVLRELARREGTTSFALLLAAYHLLLGRLSGQTDLLVGAPVANRARAELKGLIGFFVNTLVLRGELAGDPPFVQLLARTRAAVLEAISRQDLPFERLVEELRPERSLAHLPLVQAVFVLQNAPFTSAELPELTLRCEERHTGTAKFDLTVVMAEEDGGFSGWIEYASDLFDGATVARFAARFERLLAAIAETPERRLSELPWLPQWELHQVVHGWNDTATGYPSERSVHELFAEVAAAAPERVALECGDRQLSYGALAARSSRLACRLRGLGVGPEVFVAVCARRSMETVVAFLAVLEAGGAYVPLDPAYPQRRQELMLADSGAAVLLRQEGMGEGLSVAHVVLLGEGEEKGEALAPAPASGADDPAYVMFTSGSTGRPKGVCVLHRGVVRMVRETNYARFGPQEVLLHLATTSFDASTLEIWGALLNGSRLVVVPAETPALEELARTVERHQVTTLFLTTALFHQMVEAQLDSLRGVSQLMAGGDVLSPVQVRQAVERRPGAVLIDCYGPTENTTLASCQRLHPGEPVGAPVPIGRPVANTRVYLLDGSLRPAAIGVAGEVLVGGAGLARGYLGLAERTAEAFLPDPLGNEPGGRLYRTGDRARTLADGRIEFLGRMDAQVKVRGFRVEPGEIETALAEHAGVRQAAVAARADGVAGRRLVAYVVAAAEQGASAGELRAYLRERLPEPMVPSAFVMLPALPVTPNGKLDRAALPAPDGSRPDDGGHPFVAPRSGAEQILARIWSEVLGVTPIGIHDDFFDLGGHSLLATRMVSAVRLACGVELPLRDVFEAPTIGALAARVEAALPTALPPIERLAAAEAPLSFSQERLWFLEQYEPGTATFNLPSLLRLRGRLDVGALARALAEIARRHESLRTSFRGGPNGPIQSIAPKVEVPLPLIDLGTLSAGAGEREARALIARETAAPFPLDAAPLLRTRLFRLAAEAHLFLLDMHHIVSDGWSIQVLIRETAALYEAFSAGRPSPLADLGVQYADFAAWQRGWLTGERLAIQLSYWTERLAGAPPLLDLPTDRRRPAVQTYRGAQVALDVDSGLATALHRLSTRTGATLFMTLLAAFKLLLARWSGERDIVVGTPVAGRTHADLEGLIGFFLNTLVLRTDLAGEASFDELLQRVRQSAVEAYGHQDLPFEKLLEALQPQRDLSRTPLFQVFFNLLNFPHSALRLPGLTLEVVSLPEVPSKFDLTVYATERGEGIHIDLVYNADLFDTARAKEMLRQLEHVLIQAVEEPGQPLTSLSLLTGAAAAVLPDPTSLLSAAWYGAVHERFAWWARRAPAGLAAADGTEEWTYGELDARANRLANCLLAAGVRRGEVVAIWAHRSATLAWTVLGVLKAGAAFVLLDPAYPGPRTIAYLRLARPTGWLRLVAAPAPPPEVEAFLDELSPRCRLDLAPRATATAGDPLAGVREADPRVDLGADDLAYVAFTSGSTGLPKGILGRHGSLTHFLPWLQREFGFDAEDRFSMLSGLSHDPLHRDLFTPLQVGAAVVIPDPDEMAAPGWLARWMRRERITIAHLTPAMGRLLTEPGPGSEKVEAPSLRWAFLVGDVLTRGDVARLEALAPALTCVNFYGSTETQRAVGYHVVRRAGSTGREEREVLPLGRGMEDVQLLVLDSAGRLAGVGEVGEVGVRSPHLAAGYLDSPALTAERFVVNPTTGRAGDRLYRTGDLGRYQPDGVVTFAGRADQQVKVRGFRIELGEIEAVLARHPGILEAVALAVEDPRGERRLGAWVVPQPGASPAPDSLRSFLAERLPDYMVPSAFVLLDSLPLTPNRKIDRRALPAPDWGRPAAGSFAPPRNPIEEALAEIWAEVLGVERVGIHDSFFELGGHSLLATQVVSRVRDTLGMDLPLRSLFATPTIAALAGELAAGRPLPAAPPLVRVPWQGDLPLSFAQERLWFLDQLQPESPAYHVPGAVRLSGGVDAAALAGALQRLVDRHESLRTTFPTVEGRPVQVVASLEIELPLVDLAALPQSAGERQLAALAAAAFRRPFDLSRGPLLRALLLRLAEREHALVAVFHHIIIDGWSLAVFFGELAALYEAAVAGRPPALPALPVQYADFAVWQRVWMQGEVLAGQLAYWQERLGAGPEPLELPADRPRPAVPSFQGARHPINLGADLTAGLKSLSAGRRVTLFMTLLAALDVLLHRTTGQSDLVVGSPIANRNRREIEGLIGMFFNLLALRTGMAGGETFHSLLQQVRETALGAYAHQDLPFEKLLAELQPERQLNRTPLFQVTLVLQNAPLRPIELADLSLVPFQVESGNANFELNVQFSESPHGLVGAFEYRTELFDRSTVARLAERLRIVLEAAAAEPEARLLDLPLLAAGEWAQVVREWNDTAAAYERSACIHELFAAHAAADPAAPAVLCRGAAWTYGEVAQRAHRLAHHLIALGVGPGVRVGVHLSRSAEMVPALLGILQAGGAYVPLDPAYPEARIVWILESLGVEHLVTQSRHLERIAGWGELAALRHLVCVADETGEAEPAGVPGRRLWRSSDLLRRPASAPPPRAGADDEAYIIFTSGSTGTPKGVQVRHRPVINLIEWVNGTFGIGRSDRVLFLASLSFDLSVYDIFGVLAAGGSVRVVVDEELGDPEALVGALRREPITFWDSAPAALQQLVPFLPGEAVPSALRLVFLSGDWIPVALPDQVRRAFPGAQVVSLGGATEATVWSNFFPVGEVDRRWVSIPYGRPFQNARYHVLDSWLNPCPVGVAGDLYIGGECLSSGYVGEASLTAQKYLPDPFADHPGGHFYATGDRARLWPDGTLEFLGRLDHQVKIRGFRIELGEIEAALRDRPAVLDAVVLAREDTPGDKRLVAYVVAAPGDGGQAEEREREQVAHWGMVYDATYGGSATADPAFDVSGWISSYTGLPIPQPEMQEWVDRTVERILGLAPRRVIEIGCGTGLLLFRIAPQTEIYWGTDLSRVSLKRIERELPARGLARVRLLQKPADDWSELEPGAFDAVVINSVTQHFPGADYLMRVISGAVATVTDGGFVFVGDVRSLPHLEAFHASLQLHGAPDALTPEELRSRVDERVAHEEELVIAPALFLRLQERLPRIAHVEVEIQRGRHHNEVTRFRYSAVIRVGDAADAGPRPACRNWRTEGLTLAALRRILVEEEPEALIVRGIPNTRLAREARALAWLRGEAGPSTLGELRAELEDVTAEGHVDPEDCWDLGRELPYEVRVLWSAADPVGSFDAVLVRRGAAGMAAAYALLARETPARPWRELASDPSLPATSGRLAAELRRHLAARLPEYMVPSAILMLDALPMTSNGKIDRRALPAPDATRAKGERIFVAPRTPLEKAVSEIWAQVLGLERVGVDNHFFELGGHSLLATKVVSRLREAFKVDLPLRALFEAPTVAALAAAIESSREQKAAPPLERLPRGGPLPTSFGQQRLWFIDQLAPGSTVYHIPVAVRLEGNLDLDALERSLVEVAARHEVLRTTFGEIGGAPVQVIHSAVDCTVRTVDLRALGGTARRAHADLLAREEARRPFSLTTGPLLRALLLRLDEAEWMLLLTLHHIVSDGWSIAIMIREMAALYRAFRSGTPAPLPELPIQYADFAQWQRRWLQGEVLESQVAYWKGCLAGAAPVLQLPIDHPRPALQTFRGARQLFHLPRALTASLEGLGRRENATLFMVLLATFQGLLHRYTGQDEVSVGSPIANRTRPEIELLIGFFVNTLVLRNRFHGRPSFKELLAEVRETALGAYAHQDLPFERLLEELQPDRDVSYPPLFQVMFTLQNDQLPEVELPDLRLTLVTMDARTANFDLALLVVDAGDGLPGTLTFNTDLFEPSTVVRMIGHLSNLLAAAAADPARGLWELSLLSAAEQSALLVEWNEPRPQYPADGCMHWLFEGQVQRRSGDPAVICGGEEVSYGELERRSNRLARRLKSAGVGPEVLVGIMAERSPELVVGLLAVLKAGGAFVPLDPDTPRERLALLLRSTRLRALLTQDHLLARLPELDAKIVCLDGGGEARAEEQVEGGAAPDHLAYVMYTSGSTGMPKGVMIPHRGLYNRIAGAVAAGHAVAGDRFLHKASIGFDVSLLEILIPLAAGGCTVMARPGGHQDPTYLVRLMAEHGVTQAIFAPSLLRAVLDEEEIAQCSSLRAVASSAEALPLDLQERFSGRLTADLYNRYGPTETSIAVTSWRCERGSRERTVPIGRPLAQAQIFVLDRELQPVPIGVPGELHVGGAGLARGYLDRPELSAECFGPHPWSAEPGSRLYRTGDLVRHRRDGAVEFLGRIDHQVKIRGVRIELGEVEAALEEHADVREVAVVDRDDPKGGKVLVAYVVPAASGRFDAGALRGFLQERLPEPAVPSLIVRLDKLPLLPSGKLDREALPEPRQAQIRAAPLHLAPRTPTEELVAGVWREALELESVGAEDNFFDLGGHSLLVVKVRARLQELLGREIPIVPFFRHPTVGSFARYLDEEGAAPRVVGRTRLAVAGAETAPSGVSEIAIIGLAGRFPGARDVDQFWRNLRQGVESIASFSDEELLASGVNPERLTNPTYVRAAGILDDIELFDAGFFDISPREAEATDPQHRIFLECAWEALERAGYDPASYARRIGVFAGTGMNTYLLRVRSRSELLEAVGSYQSLIGNDKDFLPTRVSYKLGLNGPSLAVQTACSTSLVAVHLACQSLRDGESDMALAGGISVQVPQKAGYRFQEGMILSPDGHCRAFDARAAGTVRGNGVGIVVLKRLADALADGDHIHAVIKASAINNDGAAKVGYTAPSVQGQAQVIADALSLAGVEPSTISYVEAHGTGTRLGDPIEITALQQVFGSGGAPGRCAIGSVKTNIGHLNAAAGVAGLIKAVLMIEHRELAPSLHFERPNPEIDFAGSPFFVNAHLAPWPSDGAPRRAGVSSFGIGGTNAHVVLEEPPAGAAPAPARPVQLLLVSARSEAALAAAAGDLARWLSEHPAAYLADVAYTLQVGRRRFGHRLALACRGMDEAAAALADLDPQRLATTVEDAAERQVAFLFPGQGSQHVGMALELYGGEPFFRAELDRVADLFRGHLDVDLRQILDPRAGDPEENPRRLEQTVNAQATLFAVEYALARLWMCWGIHPRAMIGHSVGEYVAACLAGVFSLEHAVAVVAARGRLVQQLPGGVMLVVPLGEEELAPLLGDGLALAALNGPAMSVASGPAAAIHDLAERLAARGVEPRRLHTSHAFHSPMMEPAVGPFEAVVREVTLKPPQIPCLSNVSGGWLTAAEATDPAYWAAHLRRTVRFSQGLCELFRQPDLALLEVGPGRALSTLARQHPERPAAQPVVTSLPHPGERVSDLESLLGAAGRLWLAGARIDWQAFHDGGPRRRVPLTTYPFERRRFWAEVTAPAPLATPSAAARPAAPAGARVRPELPAPPARRPGVTAPYVAPRNALERRIADLWERLLGVDAAGVYDDFFELGGSSLLIVQLRAKLAEATGFEVPPHFLLEAPTIAAIAESLKTREGGEPAPPALAPCLVELQRGDRGRPLFLVHPAGGHVYFYRDLAAGLDSGRPVYGLRAHGLEEDEAPLSRIEAMAAHYLAAVRSVQPEGPFLLGGSSMGGTIAYEMAQQLHAGGQRVDLLALIDTPGRGQMPTKLVDEAAILSYLAGPSLPAQELCGLEPEEQLRRVLAAAKAQGHNFAELDLATARRLLDLFKEHMRAMRKYVPKPYPGRIVFFRASTRRPTDPRHPERPWIDLATGGIEIHPVPGHHISMHHPPNVEVLLERLRSCLAKSE